jgi:hypothetical protein
MIDDVAHIHTHSLSLIIWQTGTLTLPPVELSLSYLLPVSFIFFSYGKTQVHHCPTTLIDEDHRRRRSGAKGDGAAGLVGTAQTSCTEDGVARRMRAQRWTVDGAAVLQASSPATTADDA